MAKQIRDNAIFGTHGRAYTMHLRRNLENPHRNGKCQEGHRPGVSRSSSVGMADLYKANLVSRLSVPANHHLLRSTLTANSFCRCATRRFPAFEPLTVGVSDVLTDGYFKLAMELGFEFQAGLNGKCRVTSPVFRWARGRTSSCPNINDNLGSESTWELYWKRVAAFYSTHSLLLAPRNAMGVWDARVSA